MNAARKLGGTLGPGVWWRLAAGVAMLTGGLAGTILLVRPDSTPIMDSPVVSSSVRLPTDPRAVTAQELQEAILRWAADLPAQFPDSADALHASAVLYFELLRPVEAETSWRACLEIAPDHAEASLGLAILATERGEDELAVQILQQTLATGNRSAEVYHHLAVALSQLGKLAEAGKMLQTGLARFPQAAALASAYAGLAEVYRKAGDLQQARRWAEESVRWEPNIEGYQRLAEICRESGDRRSAQAAQQEADRLRGKASDGP